MSAALTEYEAELARRKEIRDERRKREIANRINTSLKPHLKELLTNIADANRIPVPTMTRVLILEALEGRGYNLDNVLANWKERNPEESNEQE